MRLSRLLVVFPALLLLTLSAHAETNSTLLEDLNAEDYETRQSTTERLLLDESLTTEQLAAWYALAESPEARQRLLSVARHHFLRQMRAQSFSADGNAAIGIGKATPTNPPLFDAQGKRLRPQPGGPARPTAFVLVTRVLDGFPATGRLRPLDRIMALDGQPLNGNAFKNIMDSRAAQQDLTLTVLRGGETIEVVLPLANSEALVTMYPTPDLGLAGQFDRDWTQYQKEHFSLVE